MTEPIIFNGHEYDPKPLTYEECIAAARAQETLLWVCDSGSLEEITFTGRHWHNRPTSYANTDDHGFCFCTPGQWRRRVPVAPPALGLTEAEFNTAAAAGETLRFVYPDGAEPYVCRFTGRKSHADNGWAIAGGGWDRWRDPLKGQGYWERLPLPAPPSKRPGESYSFRCTPGHIDLERVVTEANFAPAIYTQTEEATGRLWLNHEYQTVALAHNLQEREDFKGVGQFGYLYLEEGIDGSEEELLELARKLKRLAKKTVRTRVIVP